MKQYTAYCIPKVGDSLSLSLARLVRPIAGAIERYDWLGEIGDLQALADLEADELRAIRRCFKEVSRMSPEKRKRSRAVRLFKMVDPKFFEMHAGRFLGDREYFDGYQKPCDFEAIVDASWPDLSTLRERLAEPEIRLACHDGYYWSVTSTDREIIGLIREEFPNGKLCPPMPKWHQLIEIFGRPAPRPLHLH